MAEITVSIRAQTLTFSDHENVQKQYVISSALNGVGQQMNSGQTPLGEHYIRAKIGQHAPINAVFKGRRPTGEICNSQLMNQYPDRDWILTRILWLCGKQPGFNRLGAFDTMRRYIYIHGTPYENELGQAVSHGCIRMSNTDVIELFDLVNVGCPVMIYND